MFRILGNPDDPGARYWPSACIGELHAMRTLSRTCVALGLVALMAGPALAQQGRGGGRGFGGGGLGMLLGNASVQQELKLDASQIEKAKGVAGKAREKVTSALEGLEGQDRFAK